MKIKRVLAFLAVILFAISAIWITNQPEQVSASVFQKTSVPKKFRGMAMTITTSSRDSRLQVLRLC